MKFGKKSESIVFIDTEIGAVDKKIHDIGAVKDDKSVFHSALPVGFASFISDAKFICGHNIVNHDLKFLENFGIKIQKTAIDTLFLSPLLFPRRPYHALLKDDKLQREDLNNPVNDCKKAAELFYDEVGAFNALSPGIKRIFFGLLHARPEFRGFFKYVRLKPAELSKLQLQELIRKEYAGEICANADLLSIIASKPVELAYALALIGTDDEYSVTPPWLLGTYPGIENIIKYLRATPCAAKCEYCRKALDAGKALKRIFGYENFRTYDGEPLQEKAVRAAIEGKSLLAVFPTGGGKSLTFQLPALMAGKAGHALTVVISPLQSLMKDQVDNLNKMGITQAVTVNGLLSSVEKANAYERVANGSAALLYISPEQLRSKTIEKMLLSRNIARFVIDEAHCFSAWGHDFRVDYLYIGDFIKELQQKKNNAKAIPVSCFTATAKQKVISDIRDYFAKKLNLNMELFAASSTRENLRYNVLYKDGDEEKYAALRTLLGNGDKPSIVYVSRQKRAMDIAEKLNRDGFSARPFHGGMSSEEKIANQEAFIRNDVRVMVATSAFGMGVDKKDIGLVVHYDISNSLEDYVQETGRAGRDPQIEADCYVLFGEGDLDGHFALLNQTKISMSEIQQVWRAIKEMTKLRANIRCSALELARKAGWDDSLRVVENRVKTAVAALENAGYVERGKNSPHVYATSILAKNMSEASFRIEQSPLFSKKQRQDAKRIIKSLISSRSIAAAGNDDAESRIDYLADILGMTEKEVINSVNLMRQEGLLEDSRDMSAYIYMSDSENKSQRILSRFSKLESFMLSQLREEGCVFRLKEMNEALRGQGMRSQSNLKDLRTLINYYSIKNHILISEQNHEANTVKVLPMYKVGELTDKYRFRTSLCEFILQALYAEAKKCAEKENGRKEVLFSLVGLCKEYRDSPHMNIFGREAVLADMEDALLYLLKIGALKLEGDFLVYYAEMEIKRLAGGRVFYKKEDYRLLDEFYKQKIRQIHIVGEYANLMVKDYDAALSFVHDYFNIDFNKFIEKYFKGDRAAGLEKNITPTKYKRLFGELSGIQSKIINDDNSKNIVVAAGPGSGKTRVLVHKLAALLLLDDVKTEQLLMLTFSRAAATEFKKRLLGLVGSVARYVDIKTFHSYCFDLLGRNGNLEEMGEIVNKAAELIGQGAIEQRKITKSVLVIDEAQDMDENEFKLIKALMNINENMRLIAVGDDDQNIFAFRGSDSRYMRAFAEEFGAVKYEMTENYRSKANIVRLENEFTKRMENRMKESPAKAVQEARGKVVITRCYGEHMESAVAGEVAKTREKADCCVLTNTNEEALRITGLLLKKGVRAKLIQSFEGFNLCDLAEIRFFLRSIDSESDTPVIPINIWEKAKQRLFENYARSSCLENCKKLIHDFEILSGKAKYRTDLEEFIRESDYGDFYEPGSKVCFVSTIHKAKGREFDKVYMMLQGNRYSDPEEKRKIYVGMTRAKSELYIFTDNDFFSDFSFPGLEYREDRENHEEPEEIVLRFTHKDVVLDFFKGKKKIILGLRSGDKLSVDGPYLFAKSKKREIRVAKFSKAAAEKITALSEKGYRPYAAKVRFIAAWKGEEDSEESAVLLPDIGFKKYK